MLVVAGSVTLAASSPTDAQVAAPAELISTNQAAATRNENVDGISGDGRYVAWHMIDPSKPTRAFVTDRFTGQLKEVPGADGPLGIGDVSLSRGGCHVAYWANSGIDGTGEAWRLRWWDHCTGGAPADLASEFSDPPFAPRQVAVSADGSTVAYTALSNRGERGMVAISRVGTAAQTSATLPTGSAQVTGVDISDDGAVVTLDVVLGVNSAPGSVAAVPGSVAPPGSGSGSVAPPGSGSLVMPETGSLAMPASVVAQPAGRLRQVIVWRPANPRDIALVSARADGEAGSGASFDSSISGDGRYVAFTTDSADLVGVDLGGRQQVVVRDLATTSIRLVSDVPGSPLAGGVGDADINLDGSQVAISMLPRAVDLPAGAVTQDRSVYVAAGQPGLPGPIVLDLVGFGVDGLAAPSSGGVVSNDARFVAFDSEARGRLTGSPPPSAPTVDVWARERVARLTADPASVDFGAVQVDGAAPTRTVTIRNGSSFTVPVTGLTAPSAPFDVVANGCAGALLAPGATCSVTVRFRPTGAAAFGSSVRISANTGSVDILLRGRGEVPSVSLVPEVGPVPGVGALTIDPDVIDFGTTLVGAPLPPRSATVTNTGAAAVTISSSTIGGPGQSRFAIAIDGCTGAVLAPGTSCSVSLGAIVDVSGAHTATLTVAAGPLSAVTTLRVSASFDPVLTVSPAVVRPGEVAIVVGVGFPANTTIDLTFDGVPWQSVTTDQFGGFRKGAVLLAPFSDPGNVIIAAVDQPTFTGIEAPLLINPASFRPGGFDGALAGGVRNLYATGG
jgi:hypothetical protein